jgi:hypothetical protein
MTDEKILARESKRWYIWAAASTVVIVADMVLHGVTGLKILPAGLSIVFAYFVFRGKQLEDRVIARYQKLAPTGRTPTMTTATRVEVLHLLEQFLWPAWFVLLASCLVFQMVGNLNLSGAITEGMIAFILAMIPLRLFIAAALFWPGQQDHTDGSA